MRRLILLSGLALAACTDSTLPPDPVSPPGPSHTVELTCTVTVATAGLSCSTPVGPSGASRVIVGGQNTYVRLMSRDPAYDAGTQVFQAGVAVENLLAQAMGTTTGSDTTGVDVYFATGPTATDGAGTIAVLNADTGSFTAADQIFYHYPELLQTNDTSAFLDWSFSVPNTVNTFAFTVYVHGDIPHESSVLLWRRSIAGLTNVTLNGVYVSPGGAAFAVGESGVVLHWDGTGWSTGVSGVVEDLNSVTGTSDSSVLAGGLGRVIRWNGSTWASESVHMGGRIFGVWAGSDSLALAVGVGARHFDGASWDTVAIDTAGTLYAVWGVSDNSAYAVGENGMIVHWDGAAMTSMSSGVTSRLYAVWGVADSVVFAASENGDILRYDGVSWTQLPSPTGVSIRGITGTSGSDVYFAGSNGVVLRWDGSAFHDESPTGTHLLGASGAGEPRVVGTNGLIVRREGGEWGLEHTGATLQAAWGSSASNVFVAGLGGILLHYDGTSWHTVDSNTQRDKQGLWGASATDIHAVGASGEIHHFNGTAWLGVSSGTAVRLYAVHGSAADNVIAVGEAGTILHYAGAAWAPMTNAATDTLRAVWVGADTSAFAVGLHGVILHYDGTDWLPMTSGTTDNLFAVWGSSPTDVWAGGFAGTRLHWNGTAWTDVSSGFSTFVGMHGTTASDVWSVGGAQLLHNDGTGWVALTSGGDVTREMQAVWAATPTSVFAPGELGTIYHGTR